MKCELNGSGISVDERTPVEEALEDIIAKEKEMAKQHDIESAEKSEKVEADKLTAEDMRLQSLETFATGSPYYRLLEKYFVQEIIFRSSTYHCVVLLLSFRLHSHPNPCYYP